MGRWPFGVKTEPNHSNWNKTRKWSVPSVGTGRNRRATCSPQAALIRWIICKLSESPSIIRQMTRCVSLTTEGHRLGFGRADCAPHFPFSFKFDLRSDLDLGWCLRFLFLGQNNQNLPVGPIRTFKEFQSSGKWMNQSAESTSYSRHIGRCMFSPVERGRWSTGQLLPRRIHQGDADWNDANCLSTWDFSQKIKALFPVWDGGIRLAGIILD